MKQQWKMFCYRMWDSFKKRIGKLLNNGHDDDDNQFSSPYIIF